MAVGTSAAVERARQRRVAAADVRLVRIQWFLDNVVDKVKTPLRTRVKMAAEYVRDKCVRNISRPVAKTPVLRQRVTSAGKKGSQYTKVTDRSKSGEFPKADTTQLMKTLFSDVKEISPGAFEGYVGTPLLYGLALELKMARQFLTRTLNEERATIIRILTGPIQ